MLLVFSYFILLIVYVIILLYLRRAWRKITVINLISNDVVNRNFSMIIPFRNEAENVEKLLTSLRRLDYAVSDYEVILVDDFSEDNSCNIIQSIISKTDNIKLIHNKDNAGKKGALSCGVMSAAYENIITIDADCTVSSKLLKLYNKKLEEDEYDFISGPVIYQENNFFTGVLNYELLGLVMIGAASLQLNKPTMANGANLYFNKKSFNKVNGYISNLSIASGDDEFLMRSLSQLENFKAGFLKAKEAVVMTTPPKNIKGFIQQRIRWSSKWRYNSGDAKITPILVFLFYLIQIVAYFQITNYNVLIVGFIAKILVESFFMYEVLKFFRKTKLLLFILLIQIYYPFYIVIVAFLSLFLKKYTWKGRLVE